MNDLQTFSPIMWTGYPYQNGDSVCSHFIGVLASMAVVTNYYKFGRILQKFIFSLFWRPESEINSTCSKSKYWHCHAPSRGFRGGSVPCLKEGSSLGSCWRSFLSASSHMMSVSSTHLTSSSAILLGRFWCHLGLPLTVQDD